MYFQPKNVLELGTSVGIGTSALALGNKNSNITSIEGCPKIADLTIQQLKKQTIDNVAIINDDFKPALLNMATSHWDFVFLTVITMNWLPLNISNNYFQRLITILCLYLMIFIGLKA